MSDVVYRPGEWQVVVEESGVAALPADASSDKVVALSAMLGRGVPALTEVIDVLSGGAITGLGSFAVALIGAEGTRFAVRGGVSVSTGYEEGFSGEDITTWSERFIAGPPRFELGFGDGAEAPDYPIRSGVVLASGVRVGEAFAASEEESPLEAETPAEAEAVLAVAEQADAEDQAEPVIAADAEDHADPEPTPESESEDQPEPAPDPAPSSGDAGAVHTETISPDEMLLVRRDSEQPAEPDPTQTIAPPAEAVRDDGDPAASAPSEQDPAAESGLTIPPPPAAPEQTTASGLDIGDHDGATISLAEARRLRRSTSAPDAPTEVMPVVPGEPVVATSARIRLSTGQVVELDRPVIIGRKPRSTRASGSTLPHLVAVDSPQSDISRNHLEVRPEGDSVVIVDLHTTNGSTLLRPGSDPVRLHPGEPTLALGGDVIDLGDGVTVIVEELG